MAAPSTQQVRKLFQAWGQGKDAALDELLPVAWAGVLLLPVSESASCLHLTKRKREADWLTQFGDSWVKISDRISVQLRLARISNWLDRKGIH
jgi:hypothetical protein